MLERLKQLIKGKIPENYYGQGDYIYVEAEEWLIGKHGYEREYVDGVGCQYINSQRKYYHKLLPLPDAIFEALLKEIRDYNYIEKVTGKEQ